MRIWPIWAISTQRADGKAFLCDEPDLIRYWLINFDQLNGFLTVMLGNSWHAWKA